MLLAYVLVRGLLQVAIVPPWQHPDEPTHLEYIWLLANRRSLPQVGDFDQTMRREVASSMIEHGFFRGSDIRPDLLADDEPIWIGLSELEHPPVYYLLSAPLLYFLSHLEVVDQLYVARLVSVLLWGLSIWIASRLVAEILPPGHALRWAAPAMMALLPAYVDLMTAVSNDVGATVVLSFFLWGAVRAIRRGLSLSGLLWLVGAAALGGWTKNTALVAWLLLPLTIAWAWLRRPWTRWAWAAPAAVGLVAMVALVGWGDAALWYRGGIQDEPTRQQSEQSPLGAHVLRLTVMPETADQQFEQPLLADAVEALRGQTVTLGAWVWASRPARISSPSLRDGSQRAWQWIEVDTTPAWQAITATVTADAEWLQVLLQPWLGQAPEQAIDVYYDGLALIQGERSPGSRPLFDDDRGQGGIWDGQPFVNWLRNGSAESAWPRVRPWAEVVFFDLTHRPPMLSLASALDWQRTGWLYGAAASNLLHTFWARFGWAHISLPAGWYGGLDALTLAAAAGTAVGLWRFWRSGPALAERRAVGLLILAALLVWGNALLRVHPLIVKPFIPSARYAYPAIAPTSLALMGGWLALTPRWARRRVAVGLLAALALLDVFSLATVMGYYYGG